MRPWAAVIAIVMGASSAMAQPVCDEAELTRLSAALTAADVSVPRPPRERGSECMSVSEPILALGAPVVGRFAGVCPVVALVYEWTTTRSETCGNDVYFPPLVSRGVVVLSRRGERWRRVAIGAPTAIASLDALGHRDVDGDGATELVLGHVALAIDRRRVVVRPAP